jgi:hypothetical protein
MFSIITTVTSNASGRAQVKATGHGRQKTISLDHSKSDAWNRGAACGALLNLLTTDEQQAKLRHPSGGQRVQEHALSDGGGKHRFVINV